MSTEPTRLLGIKEEAAGSIEATVRELTDGTVQLFRKRAAEVMLSNPFAINIHGFFYVQDVVA